MARLIDADEAIRIWQDKDYIKTSSQLQRAEQMLKEIPTVDEWIPIKTRPITQEEIEEYGWNHEAYSWMYACELPDDGEEVLITTKWGSVEKVTFYNDLNYGSYFEEYEDEDDVIAWRPLPEKYQKETQNEN